MDLSITKYREEHRPALLELWEQSVRATHAFLAVEDIDYYKSIVWTIDFSAFDVYCAFDEGEAMIGILGVADGKLEMLFLRPESIGKGVGRFLLDFAVEKLKINAVDVNEGNVNAVEFYKRFGFEVYDRSPLDDQGKPYPILKMRL